MSVIMRFQTSSVIHTGWGQIKEDTYRYDIPTISQGDLTQVYATYWRTGKCYVIYLLTI